MSPLKLQQLLQQAVTHHRAGRLAEAEILYRQARAAAPRHFDVLHLSGTLAYQQGRTQDGVDLLTRALRLDPRSAVCRMRLGLALVAAGSLPEAEKHLRTVVQKKPDFAEAWDNLAYCLKAQDRLPEALECHQQAVALKPDHALSWYNYGLTLSLMGHSAEALHCHERALAADPGYALARFGRAQALQQCSRIAEAIEEYGRFLDLEPDHHQARSYRLFALQYLDGPSREQIFAEHVAFGRAIGSPPAPDLPNPAESGRRLRVAILSPDLRSHSCAFFIEPLLQHLDRTQFELLLYLDHIREDAISARLRGLAGVWRNFIGQPDPDVERTIRADQPDILIDLAGHTGMNCRLPLYARRLAPVQITYLGYPDTTGLPAMDYRLTDAIADPVGDADRFATEQLVRFAPTAWTYLPMAGTPEPNPPPCLAGAPVTFGCCNNLAKINATTLRLWAGVLQAAPDSRLVLKGRGLGDPAVREHYLAPFQALGLAAGRIELLERTVDTRDHLAVYHRIDIALDTFPYHGTTTTCEALWMGVPVVTLRGDRHVARVSASLLTAVGHPEWIAATADEYTRIAAHLGADRPRLAALRAGLRDEMRRSPLLDHPGQAARFGAALRACWHNWCTQPRAARVA
ncbi:MAG: tetratricopeptide repeat protein [Opitutaceae bacterium]|nr:tetratricopeptide repeat protein [Opitutaceae bacterium]